MNVGFFSCEYNKKQYNVLEHSPFVGLHSLALDFCVRPAGLVLHSTGAYFLDQLPAQLVDHHCSKCHPCVLHMIDFVHTNKRASMEPTDTKCAVLFTDIVGSSQHWQQTPSEMFAALQAHIQQVRALCVAHNGEMLKMIGDAFLIIFMPLDRNEDPFESTTRATAFAMELQSQQRQGVVKIREERLKLRIGIAYGSVNILANPVQECANPDVFGNVVNTASRLESKVSETDGFAIGWSFTDDQVSNNQAQTLVNRIEQYADQKEGEASSCFNVEARLYNADCLETHVFQGLHPKCNKLELKGVKSVFTLCATNAYPIEESKTNIASF
jgi:hypothetical protein